MPTHRWWGIILLRVKINISNVNKNKKKFFFRVNMHRVFFHSTRIRTHNLSRARTLPYRWATSSHVINNEIFFFYHHFLMSYITCFTARTISNEKNFNYKIVDLVASYNFRIHLFSIWGHLKILKILNSKFKPYIWVPKQPQLKKNLNYKVVDLVEAYNFCIDQFLIWDNLNFSKIVYSNINKSYKGDAPWCCTSPMSSQRWRALMLTVTFCLS